MHCMLVPEYKRGSHTEKIRVQTLFNGILGLGVTINIIM
jgi:hypothetical protein